MNGEMWANMGEVWNPVRCMLAKQRIMMVHRMRMYLRGSWEMTIGWLYVWSSKDLVSFDYEFCWYDMGSWSKRSIIRKFILGLNMNI